MPINFPASPNVNDTFTEGSITYKCLQNNPTKWIGLGTTPADRLVEGSNNLEINSSNNLVWTGNNVGIRDDSPDDLLSIKKSSSTAYDATAIQSGGARLSIFNSNNTLSDTFADIHFKCHSTSSAEARIGMRLPSINNSELFFITENNNNLVERLRIASDGQVSISSDGTTDGLLTIKGNSDATTTPSIRLLDGSDTREVSISNTSGDFVASVHGDDNAVHGHIKMFESGIFSVANGGAAATSEERFRITTDGTVNIGGDYSQTDNHVQIVCPSKPIQEGTLNLKSSTTTGAADTGAVIRFSGHSGTEDRYHSSIKGCKENGTSGNYAGYLAFSTRPNGQGMIERVRIRSNGDLTTKQEASENRTTAGFTARNGDSVQCTRDAGTPLEICRTTNTGTLVNFFSGSSAVASISFSGGIMTYGGQSDYRLKENIVEMTGGIDAVKKLNPIKFNFISSPENTLEGFIAHEVQEVIPQAVVGEKDAEIDEEGKGYQQLDPVHLVPTLTKALQEAITKIETLEARVAQLEGN